MTGLVTTKALILHHINVASDHIDVNPKMIAEELDIEYGYVTTLISQIEDEKLIHAEEDGRRKVLTLTPTGEAFAKSINDMLNTASQKLNSKEVLNKKIY